MRGLFGVLVLLGIFLWFSLSTGSAMAGCPADNTYINETTVLAGGFCNVGDADDNGVLIINSSNIFLDCNGTVFNGSGSFLYNTGGIKVEDANNVTIFNCTVQNYYYSVFFSDVQDSSINKSNISSSTFGIGIYQGSGIHSKNNILESNYIGIYYSHFGGNSVVQDTNITGSLNISLRSWNSGTVNIQDSNISGAPLDINTLNASVLLSSTTYDSLKTEWYLKINVTNTSKDSIYPVQIEIFDINRTLVRSTTILGGISSSEIAEYIKNSSGTYNFTPHTINVSKAGYYTNSTAVYLTQSLTVHITLNESPVLDREAPSIGYSISPQSVLNGSQVTIFVNATDNAAVDRVWALIDYPGGQDRVWLNNSQNNTYKAIRTGRHNVTIFANDTSGNQSNVTDYFVSAVQVAFNTNVTDYNSSGIDSRLVIYEANTSNEVISYSSSSGDFPNKTLQNGTYDFSFLAFSDEFTILLEDVRIWENTNKQAMMDKLPDPVSGFELTYAAETTYGFSQARVRVYYDEDDVADEDSIDLYLCSEWDFPGRSCQGGWTELNATLNKASNHLEAYVSGFSAFSVKQEEYCGDGVCSGGEDSSSCQSDCACNTGDTRPCSENHHGLCMLGSETCIGGIWAGCPQPAAERCNMLDDDCDGVTDNVGGGDSIETTKCGCYNGASPAADILDGIDNDCDGEKDEGCVCTDGETDICGSSLGECRAGVMRCKNCTWGVCEGNVGPFDEVCSNNKDDDCDGDTDETGCIVQTNETCAYGLIPARGCICGGGTYASGYCCNGIYQEEPCPEFPAWIFIVIGLVILVVIVAYHFLYERRKEEKEWKELKRKYVGRRGV